MKKYTFVITLILTLVLFNYCEKESNPTEPANQPPTITSLVATPDSLNPGESSTIVCLTHDPDGDSLTYSWSKTCGNFTGSGNSVEWKAPNFTGNCTITCVVEDVAGNLDSASVLIKVYNTTPMINEITVTPDSIHVLGLVNVECITIDPDGDSLDYTWSTSGGTITGSGSTVEWNAPSIIGTYTISCTVNDPQGAEDSSSVLVAAFNNSPIISGLTASADSIDFNEIINISCQVEDPDGDDLTFTWIAEAGSITGTDSIVQWLSPTSSGNYRITCIVNDDFGGADSIYKYINVFNNSPIINNLFASEDTVKILSETDIVCNAVDLDGDQITYDWYSSGGSILGSDSLINWTAPDVAGDYTITCVVTDIYGQKDTMDVDIRVYLLPISTQELIGYWPIIGNGRDLSGFGNDGLVMGAQLSNDRNGNPNNAYSFDGIDDFLDMGNKTVLKPQLPITISMWIKYSDQSGSIFTSNFHDTNYFGISVGLGTSPNRINISFCDGGGIGSYSRRTKYTTPPIAGNWFHFVGIIRGVENMDIYINGINAGGTYSGTGGNIAYDNGSMNLGRHDTSTINPPIYFYGELDEIMMFNRVLTQQEIQTLYQLNW